MTKGDGKPCKRCGTSEWSERGNCKECRRRDAKKWAQENPERRREQERQWRKNNPERIREYQNKAPRVDPEIARERTRQWSKNHPDAKRANKHRRKARIKGNGGSYTAAEWEALVESYGGRCLCCGRDDVKLTVDHVVPLIMGGTNDISNIQPLCMSCNTKKKAKHIDYRTKPGILRWIQGKLFG